MTGYDDTYDDIRYTFGPQTPRLAGVDPEFVEVIANQLWVAAGIVCSTFAIAGVIVTLTAWEFSWRILPGDRQLDEFRMPGINSGPLLFNPERKVEFESNPRQNMQPATSTEPPVVPGTPAPHVGAQLKFLPCHSRLRLRS